MRILVLLSVFLTGVLAQLPPPVVEATKEAAEPGIPVTSEVVKSKCSGCHKNDGQGNLTRISWGRTTPEAGNRSSSAWSG